VSGGGVTVRTGDGRRLVFDTAAHYRGHPDGDVQILDGDDHELALIGRGQWVCVSATDDEPRQK
jgi:hypothetical protein